MIDFALAEDEELIVDSVHRFAVGLREKARKLSEARAVPEPLERDFAALGVTSGDLSALVSALVHEELAWGDADVALALWFPSLVPQALVELADAEQAARFLAPFMVEGSRARGAVAWSGEASARRDGDVWILDGEKPFVVNAGRADLYLVFAGDEAFAVKEGLSFGARAEWLGLETVTAGSLRLAGTRVPEADRLRHGSDPARRRRFFARAALVTAARQVGLARAAYETALAYTQERHAFGKAVAHFQAVSFALADMHMDVESTRWMVWRAAYELDQEKPTAERSLFLAAVHANEAAWRVADAAVQLHGGAGFIQDFPVEKWLRDTKALALVGGVDEFARLAVAEDLLGHPLAAAGPESILQPVVT